MLYESLTGLRPFPGDDLPAMMYAHLDLPPPRPSEITAGLPTDLDEVIRTGMAKKPDDRYRSAGALAIAVAARSALTPTQPIPPPAPITTTAPTATAQAAAAPTATPARPRPNAAAPETVAVVPAMGKPPTARDAPAPPVRRRGRRGRILAVALLAIAILTTILVVARPTPVEEATLTGHTDSVYGLDGQPIAVSASADKTLRVWDLHTHQQIGTTFTGHTDAVSAWPSLRSTENP
jgi:serine/threonine-protein kinase